MKSFTNNIKHNLLIKRLLNVVILCCLLIQTEVYAEGDNQKTVDTQSTHESAPENSQATSNEARDELSTDSTEDTQSTLDTRTTLSKTSTSSPSESPYGLTSLWRTSDEIAKIVLVLLLIMSAGSWYIMVMKLVEQTIIGQQKSKTKAFWATKHPTLNAGMNKLQDCGPFLFIANAANEAVKSHEDLNNHIAMSEWVATSVQRAIDDIQSNMQKGLAFLATAGSISPFVGLFGTVWGIYHALTAIGLSGQASIDKVAGPVGESLIMTAIGLAVAVPAVLAYNFLVRRNKDLMEQIKTFGVNVHTLVLSTT